MEATMVYWPSTPARSEGRRELSPLIAYLDFVGPQSAYGRMGGYQFNNILKKKLHYPRGDLSRDPNRTKKETDSHISANLS